MSESLPLKRVAVIGTGILGTQIAVLSAYTGYNGISVLKPSSS